MFACMCMSESVCVCKCVCAWLQHSHCHFFKRPYGRSYCFQAIPGATVTTAKGVSSWHGSMGLFNWPWQEDRTGACARVAFVTSGVADEVAHRVQRGKRVRVRVCVRLLLTPLQRIPGEEDEQEAQELQARRQPKVNKAEGSDIIFPAGPMETTILLPQHTGGVNHSSKIDRSGDVGWRERKKEGIYQKLFEYLLISNQILKGFGTYIIKSIYFQPHH